MNNRFETLRFNAHTTILLSMVGKHEVCPNTYLYMSSAGCLTYQDVLLHPVTLPVNQRVFLAVLTHIPQRSGRKHRLSLRESTGNIK